mgnify:FL=1
MHCKGIDRYTHRTNGFGKDCQEAYKHLTSLDIVKDMENHQKYLCMHIESSLNKNKHGI